MPLRAFVLALFALLLMVPGTAMPRTPFVQGSVGGHWIGVVLEEGGASGHVFTAPVYARVVDQVGEVGKLQSSEASGGSITSVFFARDKMFVTDELALPGQCEACYDHLIVRRFAVVRGALRQDAVGVMLQPKSEPASAAFHKAVLDAPLARTPYGPDLGYLPLDP